MSQVLQQATPVVFDTFQAYQRTAALRAAIELDLFTAIAEGHNIPARLADRCQAAERGVRILADSLTVFGLLTKHDGVYRLTAETAMLMDAKSPGYLGNAIDFLLNPTMREAFDNLAQAVRQGGTALAHGGTIAPEHPAWVPFAKGMRGMMMMPAQMIAEMLSPLGAGSRVLDVAASHGEFGLAVARRNPEAHIVALDWANVLELTMQHVREAGLAQRYETIAGSAFDANLGSAYDAALVTNFLHHFDTEACVTFLLRLHAALKPGGKVVILEFIPSEDRVSPPPAAAFSLTMLATTAHGDAYTEAQFRSMLERAGFGQVEFRPMNPSPETVVIAVRS